MAPCRIAVGARATLFLAVSFLPLSACHDDTVAAPGRACLDPSPPPECGQPCGDGCDNGTYCGPDDTCLADCVPGDERCDRFETCNSVGRCEAIADGGSNDAIHFSDLDPNVDFSSPDQLAFDWFLTAGEIAKPASKDLFSETVLPTESFMKQIGYRFQVNAYGASEDMAADSLYARIRDSIVVSPDETTFAFRVSVGGEPIDESIQLSQILTIVPVIELSMWVRCQNPIPNPETAMTLSEYIARQIVHEGAFASAGSIASLCPEMSHRVMVNYHSHYGVKQMGNVYYTHYRFNHFGSLSGTPASLDTPVSHDTPCVVLYRNGRYYEGECTQIARYYEDRTLYQYGSALPYYGDVPRNKKSTYLRADFSDRQFSDERATTGVWANSGMASFIANDARGTVRYVDSGATYRLDGSTADVAVQDLNASFNAPNCRISLTREFVSVFEPLGVDEWRVRLPYQDEGYADWGGWTLRYGSFIDSCLE